MFPSYENVNDVLNGYFFSGRFEMEYVYLDLEGDAAEEIAEALNIEVEDLEKVIGNRVAGKLSFDEGNPYRKQILNLRSWRESGRKEPPTFTALLCAFSIAAEHMGADSSFSSNNYYERLFELLDVSDATHKEKLKQNARSTRQFWRTLNLWLSENDFSAGRPTARPVNSWKYVSYSLSQALVRDVDRKKFSRLFEHMHLAPNDNVSEAEMLLYLHEWMLGAGPTAWLKRLWSTPDLQERVVGAALDALSSWEGETENSEDGFNGRRLSWVLSLPGFPTPRASFALVTVGASLSETLSLNDNSGKTARAAFEMCNGAPRFENYDEGEPSYLGPIAEINIENLLLEPCVLIGQDTGTRYTYFAKPVIPMVRSENGPHYTEIPRAILQKNLVVLCHENWLQKVEAHLEKCARIGIKKFTKENLSGVPDNWVLLRNVEIIRSLDNVSDHLSVLNPISGGATVEFSGGLKLGPNLWHASLPPTLLASSERQDFLVNVIQETFGDTDECLISEKADGDAIDVSLRDISTNDAGNYRVVIKKGSTELSEKPISLRTANTPKVHRRPPLIYDMLDQDSSFLSARHFDENIGTSVYIEGGSIVGSTDIKPLKELDGDFSLNGIIPKGEQEIHITGVWNKNDVESSPSSESCVIRGYHHWKVAPFEDGDDRYDAKSMECLSCGLKSLSRTKRNKRARGGQRTSRATNAQIQSRKMLRVEKSHCFEGDTFDPNTVFDALCYLGQGSQTTFSTLCNFLSEEPWFAQSLSRNLISLGHIDASHKRPGRVQFWCISSPSLVFTGEDECYLAGYTSSSFLEKLRNELDKLGARYHEHINGKCPSTHTWSNLLPEILGEVIDNIRDPLGRSPNISVNFPEKLVSVLPPVSKLAVNLPDIHIEKVDELERFDPLNARWQKVKNHHETGSYRVGFHGKRYFFVDSNGLCKEGPHELVKLLAAKVENVRLHKFDTNENVFWSAIGCEPSGLFARVLVASSGELPIETNGLLGYRNISQDVASIVMSKLYS
jgi:hypothetical protein